jgi:hypothetical protein
VCTSTPSASPHSTQPRSVRVCTCMCSTRLHPMQPKWAPVPCHEADVTQSFPWPSPLIQVGSCALAADIACRHAWWETRARAPMVFNHSLACLPGAFPHMQAAAQVGNLTVMLQRTGESTYYQTGQVSERGVSRKRGRLMPQASRPLLASVWTVVVSCCHGFGPHKHVASAWESRKCSCFGG